MTCRILIVLTLSFVAVISQAAHAAPTWIAIVDGLSTGAEFAPAFRAKAKALGLDLKLVHVQSYPKYPSYLGASYHPEDYDRRLILKNDRSNLKTVVKELQKLNPTFTLAGSETGVMLADQLNSELGIRGNALEYSSLKRNKEDLYRFLLERGIISVPSTGVASVEEGLAWVDEKKVKFPLIVKPTDDAAGHGFHSVDNRAELKKVLKKMFSSRTMFGEKIERVILMTKLTGSHYAINGAIYAGRFVFTDVIEYEKDGAVYLKDILLDSKAPIVKKQIENTERVLREMHVEYGNFHFEVIDSPEYGIVPIDIAGRAMGGKDHVLVLDCTGYTQVLAMVDAILDPEEFVRRSEKGKSGLPYYEYHKAGYVIDLMNLKDGVVSDVSGVQFLETLKTYAQSWIRVKPGQSVVKTGNMLEAPGVVMLSGDPKTLEADYRALREKEAKNNLITISTVMISDCEGLFQ